MNKQFGEVLVAILNGDDFSIERFRSKLSALNENNRYIKKLENIIKNPHFISLDRLDKLVRLHEVVHQIKDKKENDPDFIAGYDEAIEIFRYLDSL